MTQAPVSSPAEEEHRVRTTTEVVASARLAQLAIRAQVMRDSARLWPILDPRRLPETFPTWLHAMATLMRTYHGQSSVAAGLSYRHLRAQATHSPAPSSLVKVAELPSEEWMARAFGFSGPGMLQRDTAQPNTALSTTLGTAARIVLDGGRTTTVETVKADPVARGWYRVTDGNPCAFCALMASRGVVYKSEDTAGRDANEQFTGAGEFKFHDHCGCSVAPSFSSTHALDPVAQEAADVYLNRGKGDALAAFRKAWDARNKPAA